VNDQLTDQDIVVGLRDGQHAAWSALCERYGVRLWKFIARLVGSDEEAVADVYQETMLAVAKSGRQLDASQTALWSWLATIGHNQSALHWRRVYRRPATGSDLNDTAVDDSPVEALNRCESAARIRDLMAEMPADYVAVLTAKYLDELSVAEIVDLLGGTMESVRSKLARARRDFRQRYERLDGLRIT
jgi:RNA polymerase sigma-70 factor (ECF subfamily)